MEVHHHPQLEHKPKPWKEYLLEYIMIFLAVMTGFFAESYREHLNERTKEHEYVVNIKKDLINESKTLARISTRNTVFDTIQLVGSGALPLHKAIVATAVAVGYHIFSVKRQGK
jgi:hypothetical protein